MKSSTNKVYCLTWSECSSSLSTTAQNLRNIDDLTDLTISAGGKIFPAHKLVLGAASPLLMELLKNTKCQHPILILAGISASDFELILDFVYRGEINVDSDKLPSLLQAAKLLDIRALLPTALVLNSSKKDTQPPIDKGIATHEGQPPTNEEDAKKSGHLLLKRKAVTKESGYRYSKINKTSNDISVSDAVHHTEDKKDTVHAEDIVPPTISPRSTDINSHEANGFEEKKIISDLPVNCKFCGVTIRQSRNLRRHIDQMHSKMKLKSKSSNKKSEKLVPISEDRVRNSNDEKQTDDSGSPYVAAFSEDSFSQLTEEILNYSGGSESEENSFPNAIVISSPMNTCSLENSVRNTISSPTTSSTSSPIESSQPLPTLLGDDICFQLSTKSSANRTNTSHTLARVDAGSSVVEQFECSHLDDSCQVNVIALKELENQLFSACFCSTENI